MLRRIFRHLGTSLYALLLRWRARTSRSPEELVDVAFECQLPFLRITPLQLRDELVELARILDQERPSCVVEIGTARGGTLFLLCHLAAPEAALVSIDLPGGPFGGGYPPWKEHLYQSFARTGQSLHLLRANSHDPATVQQVRDLLGQEIDCLLIDGDHRYTGVRADFEFYSRMVRPGGLIIFHDVRPGSAESGGDVPRFWSELQQEHEVHEILSPTTEENFGLGLLRW